MEEEVKMLHGEIPDYPVRGMDFYRENQYWVSMHNKGLVDTSGDPEFIGIHDVTLRDGEQSPGVTFLEDERVEIAKRHLRRSVEVKGDYAGVLEMRRHLSNYFKGLPDFKPMRLQLVTLTDIPALMATLDAIAERWGDFDTSQVVPAPLSHEL